MSNSKRSSAKFWLLATGVVILTSAGLAGLWPKTHALASADSRQLSRQAASANGGEAWTDYQLAVWLNPSNAPARLGLGTAELAANEPSAALVNLNRAGQGTAVTRQRVRALIETGAYSKAAAASTQLTTSPTAPDSDLVLAALANQLSHDTARLQTLSARVSSPEGLQAMSRIEAGKLPLAEVLYTTGLLRSSNEILAKLPDSYERDLLMGQIYYSWGGTSNIVRATSSLLSATRLDPSDPAPRQLLVTVYRDDNQFTLAATQQGLLNKLAAGQP